MCGALAARLLGLPTAPHSSTILELLYPDAVESETSSSSVTVLAALAHEGRLALFRLLVRRLPGRVTPSELAETLGLAPSLVSAYLKSLLHVGLVDQVRVGKSLRYRADIGRLGTLVHYLVDDCCRGRLEPCSLAPDGFSVPSCPPEPDDGRPSMQRPFNVLFVCTRNSARSLIAESIAHHAHPERFRAYSAGTAPAESPHPGALALLRSAGHDVSGVRSKHLDEFTHAEAPAMDVVITVCDRAANEECARWPGRPVTAHWSLPDPVAAKGNEGEIALAFRQTFGALERRFATFAALPFASLDRLSLQHELDELADTPSA